MIIKKTNVVLSAMMIGVVTVALGVTVKIPDTYDQAVTNDFVVASGTQLSTNGVLVVFEGELFLETNLTAVVDGQGRKLASAQMYVQMKLFDALPDADAFTNAQAAVLAVFNASSPTEGTLYALSGSNPSSWQQLLNTNNSAPIAVSQGATNLITFVLRYPGVGYTNYEYTVNLSTPDAPTQTASQVFTSPVSTKTGITKLRMVGEGALASVTSIAGDPSPLSTSVDFSVYQSADGQFLVDIYTVDENGTDDLTVDVWIDGKWTLIGTAKAVGNGCHHYQFTVSGLIVGESYYFRVIDEEGRKHLSNSAIEVKSIVMNAVRLELETFVIIFNSEDNRPYKLLIASDVAAPIKEWTAVNVQVYVDNKWSVPRDTFQGVDGGRTQIRVPKNGKKAFFKVILINETTE
ncbi:MAG: hypothetical protein WC340_01095 [Kiritimatiellia bacterium]